MKMRNTLLSVIIATIIPLSASAQFHTVTQSNEMLLQKECEVPLNAVNKEDTIKDLKKALNKDTVFCKQEKEEGNAKKIQKGNERVYPKKQVSTVSEQHSEQPVLTIPNLYAEIKRNGILYPDIVLAQAILETGWFRSPACRKKNNLFGLTNPRTGKYYEFDHWTDSVRAYYSKVQYRYRGGNYLLWLRKIGYAEDKNYIRAVIKVLKQLS